MVTFSHSVAASVKMRSDSYQNVGSAGSTRLPPPACQLFQMPGVAVSAVRGPAFSMSLKDTEPYGWKFAPPTSWAMPRKKYAEAQSTPKLSEMRPVFGPLSSGLASSGVSTDVVGCCALTYGGTPTAIVQATMPTANQRLQLPVIVIRDLLS